MLSISLILDTPRKMLCARYSHNAGTLSNLCDLSNQSIGFLVNWCNNVKEDWLAACERNDEIDSVQSQLRNLAQDWLYGTGKGDKKKTPKKTKKDKPNPGASIYIDHINILRDAEWAKTPPVYPPEARNGEIWLDGHRLNFGGDVHNYRHALLSIEQSYLRPNRLLLVSDKVAPAGTKQDEWSFSAPLLYDSTLSDARLPIFLMTVTEVQVADDWLSKHETLITLLTNMGTNCTENLSKQDFANGLLHLALFLMALLETVPFTLTTTLVDGTKRPVMDNTILESIVSNLNTLCAGIKNENDLVVSDVIEYEILPSLLDWLAPLEVTK